LPLNILQRRLEKADLSIPKTLGSSGHTRLGSATSSPILRIRTIRVALTPREEFRAAAASVYRM
jgi:hypothetical protein